MCMFITVSAVVCVSVSVSVFAFASTHVSAGHHSTTLRIRNMQLDI